MARPKKSIVKSDLVDSASQYEQMRTLKLAKYKKITANTGEVMLGTGHLYFTSEDYVDKMGYPVGNDIDRTVHFEATIGVPLHLFRELERLVGYSNYGAINGVIHSAGVPAGGLIQLKTPETVEPVLSPKVKGTMVLDSLLDAGE